MWDNTSISMTINSHESEFTIAIFKLHSDVQIQHGGKPHLICKIADIWNLDDFNISTWSTSES